jgi:hypothetical protein
MKVSKKKMMEKSCGYSEIMYFREKIKKDKSERKGDDFSLTKN